jgi:LysM domain
MPLNIVANQGTAPKPVFVHPNKVVERAQRSKRKDASTGVAFTLPIINIDMSQLKFRERRAPAGQEFQFDSGTLTLTLREEMLISSTLSNCAQKKWIEHENEHVRDFQRIMLQMGDKIKANNTLNRYLINPQWLPSPDGQNGILQIIFATIEVIFDDATKKAVEARDTNETFKTVQRDILRNCPEPYIYEVNSSDTLSGLADFFYGRGSAWQPIYQANQKVIGANPNLIRAGQRLVIPRPR